MSLFKNIYLWVFILCLIMASGLFYYVGKNANINMVKTEAERKAFIENMMLSPIGFNNKSLNGCEERIKVFKRQMHNASNEGKFGIEVYAPLEMDSDLEICLKQLEFQVNCYDDSCYISWINSKTEYLK